MSDDPFAMLEQDHRQVERILKRLADTEFGEERQQLVSQLEAALCLHLAFEESNVYPLVERELGSETAEEANVEHGLAREGLSKLQELQAAPGFGAAVEMVEGGIGHHVRDEEQEVFPEMRKRLDDDTKERLASSLRRAKSDAGLPPIDVEGASKDELLQAARDAGAEVTTRMTKDELKAALASQS